MEFDRNGHNGYCMSEFLSQSRNSCTENLGSYYPTEIVPLLEEKFARPLFLQLNIFLCSCYQVVTLIP